MGVFRCFCNKYHIFATNAYIWWLLDRKIQQNKILTNKKRLKQPN